MAKSALNSRRASRREMRRIMVPKSYCRRRCLLGKREAGGGRREAGGGKREAGSGKRGAGARSAGAPGQDGGYRMGSCIHTLLIVGRAQLIPVFAASLSRGALLTDV